ncbi:fumarylacetoacetate hydrolase family protein [Mesorhizobium sp. M0938]|uniref:fumarylacetoacetate hydrolase family protein n=1 Tax=unclassified Mesorhizobium TaxID=325217 RepID=UPI0033353025
MRFVSFEFGGQRGLGVERAGQLRGVTAGNCDHTVDLVQLIAGGPEELLRVGRQLADGLEFDPGVVTFLPPLARPPKIICVGLNYADHTKESPYEQPDYPTLFARFATTLVGHNQPIVRPLASTSLDFEGEMVVVIGRGGRHIPKARAHDHVVGYSIFNEGSVREYQFKSPQWTVGKNFDSTGGFGPALVTADEVPAGGKGLRLETRLNGATVQSASTDDMLFDVATLIETISEAITLEPGDLIVSGTPAGIGWARNPRLLMKDGDRCEVSIEGLGKLVNPVCDEVRTEDVTGKAA